ncbi:MAG: hypothetical protein L3J97_07310 [Thermoplasmata archaeon]|nr:hypothetical protein [Thermoplasmata archaeon]
MPIWPFRPRPPKAQPELQPKLQPKVQDDALADLAQMFLLNPDDPTPGSESLSVTRYDFTVESLRVVDDHLEGVRRRGLEGEALMKFVLRCGAYVGEVIRRHSPTGTPWPWVTYDDAVRLDQRLASIGKGLGTAAVLWDGREGFCFPLGKVGKYLENGAEDSVRVFAQLIIARARDGA